MGGVTSDPRYLGGLPSIKCIEVLFPNTAGGTTHRLPIA
jgi:hypothetical protein